MHIYYIYISIANYIVNQYDVHCRHRTDLDSKVVCKVNDASLDECSFAGCRVMLNQCIHLSDVQLICLYIGMQQPITRW